MKWTVVEVGQAFSLREAFRPRHGLKAGCGLKGRPTRSPVSCPAF